MQRIRIILLTLWLVYSREYGSGENPWMALHLTATLLKC